MPKLIVYVRGGVVQQVVADADDCQVMILDYDDEAAAGQLSRQFAVPDVDSQKIARTVQGQEDE